MLNIDMHLDVNPEDWLLLISELPLDIDIQFTLPVIRSQRESHILRQSIKSIVTKLSAGRNVQIDEGLPLSVAKSIARNLPLSAEISFSTSYLAGQAVSIIKKLKFGRVLVLTETSPEAASTITAALLPGRILRITNTVSEAAAIAAVKALSQGCTVRFPDQLTASMGRKLVGEMRPYQVLSLSAFGDAATSTAIVKSLASGCALQLSSRISSVDAGAIVSSLPEGCILKIDTAMSASLVQTMLNSLPGKRIISLPAYTEQNFNLDLANIRQLKPSTVLRIAPAMELPIAITIIHELPRNCVLELSSLMSDESAIAIIEALPAGCLLKLPEDLPFPRMEAWIKALKETCHLKLPEDVGKSLDLAMEAANYRSVRTTYALLLKELKTSEGKIDVDMLEQDLKAISQPTPVTPQKSENQGIEVENPKTFKPSMGL